MAPSVGTRRNEQRYLGKVTVVHTRAFSRKSWLAPLIIFNAVPQCSQALASWDQGMSSEA